MKDLSVKDLLKKLKQLQSEDRIFNIGKKVAMHRAVPRSDSSFLDSELTPIASVLVKLILERVNIPDSWICVNDKRNSFPLATYPGRIDEFITIVEELANL